MTASATYAGDLQVIGSGAPINAGAIRPIDIVAPPGTVVNVRHPGACVGADGAATAVVDLIQGRVLSQVAPDVAQPRPAGRRATSSSGHPSTDRAVLHHYHFEGNGWEGGRGPTGTTVRSARTATAATRPSRSSRRATRGLPSVTGSTRTQVVTGRTRGGLGIHEAASCRGGRDRRERTLRPLQSSSRASAGPRRRPACLPRADRRLESLPYLLEAFGTPSDTKFSNVRLHRGDVVMLRSPSGGGYGPVEQPPEHVAEDVGRGTSLASAPQPATASSSGRTAPSIRTVPSARGPS